MLGPDIFNIFINGLLNSLPNNSSIAYADDVTLIRQGDNAISASNNMQMLLNILCSFRCHWTTNFPLTQLNASLMITSPKIAV